MDTWEQLDHYIAGPQLALPAPGETTAADGTRVVEGELVDEQGRIVEGSARELPAGDSGAGDGQDRRLALNFSGLPASVGKPLQATHDWIAAVPAPGGIGLLILLLVFFNLAIIPVANGHTRLQLIWLTLTGGAKMPQDAAADARARAQSEAFQQGVRQAAQGALGAGYANLGSEAANAVANVNIPAIIAAVQAELGG